MSGGFSGLNTARASLPLPVVGLAIVTAFFLFLALAQVGARRFDGNVGLASNWWLVWAIAHLMAGCSLTGIWWARSALPSHAKTLVAAGVTAVIWALVVALLDTAVFRGASGGGWAVSCGMQVVLSGLLASLADRIRITQPSGRSNTFSILFLLIWTAVVAVLLGVGRRVAEGLNWSLASVAEWHFLVHLQVVVTANALLAIALMVCLNLPVQWRLRICACAMTAPVIALGSGLIMQAIFVNPGAKFFDHTVFLAVEALPLFAALAPWQMTRERSRPWQIARTEVLGTEYEVIRLR